MKTCPRNYDSQIFWISTLSMRTKGPTTLPSRPSWHAIYIYNFPRNVECNSDSRLSRFLRFGDSSDFKRLLIECTTGKMMITGSRTCEATEAPKPPESEGIRWGTYITSRVYLLNWGYQPPCATASPTTHVLKNIADHNGRPQRQHNCIVSEEHHQEKIF